MLAAPAHRKPASFPVANTPSSYWLQTMGGSAPLPAASKTETVFDTVIIGAGISGFSTALHLLNLEPTRKVAVVDSRGTVAGGATGRNGGLLWPNIDTCISRYAKKLGDKEAMRLYHFDHANVAAIAAFCEEFTSTHSTQPDPMCTPLEDRGIQSFSTNAEQASIQTDFTFLESQGTHTPSISQHNLSLQDAKERIPISHFHIHESKTLIADLHAHQVHPARLVLAIAHEACNASRVSPASFFPNTTITAIERTSGPTDSLFTLHTSTGETMRAKTVVHATNAWASALLPTIPILPVRNQVVVSEPIRYSEERLNRVWGMSVNNGYEYLSERPDGRIVLGGMRYLAPGRDVGVSDDRIGNLHPTVSSHLREYVHRLVDGERQETGQVTVENEWSGIMGFTVDGFPLVGELNGFVDGCDARGEFLIAGFSGHGMSRCFLTGLEVAKMVVGVPVSVEFPQSFLISEKRMEASMERVGMGEPPINYAFSL
ncbi:hypothetical protein HDU98_010158 [Podochytrium sp. JEL0797]|nr:hypothetical protein HDU98_010158 [Podochytrium sp. JEL0797]